MYASVYVPLLLSLVVVPMARLVVRRAAPDVAAKVVTIGAVAAAALAIWGLALLTAARVGQVPVVAREGHWSALRVAARNPVPEAISIVAGFLLIVGATRLLFFAFREQRLVTFIRRQGACLPQGTGLAVLDDPRPDAFALPGKPGRVVMTTSLVRALDATERRVVLAHEYAHLRHRHHWFRTAIETAAALNPFVSPARRDVAFALERWADEEAAEVVADRGTAARALAHAALLTHDSRPVNAGFGLSRLGVADRVAALSTGAPPRRLTLAVGAFLVVVVPAAFAAADATIALLKLLLDATGVGHS